MQNSKHIWIEEYKSLRAEILQNQHMRMLVLATVYTAAGVIIGIPFIKENTGEGIWTKFLPSIMLFPVLITGLAITYYLTRSILHIAGYIVRRFELDRQNEGNLQWEIRHSLYKSLERRQHPAMPSVPGTSIAFWNIYFTLS